MSGDRDRRDGTGGKAGAEAGADDATGAGAGAEDSGASGFADLFGTDARPIRGGPDRVRPQRPRATAQGAATKPRDDPSGSPGGFRFPDPSDRHRAAAAGVSDRTLAALAGGAPEPEERIDLHGVRSDGAGPLLAKRVASARARGIRCLLIVHGRGRHSTTGEAVLRDGLPGWLTRGPSAKHVLAFAPAPGRLGGDGATLVLLRKRKGS